MGDVVSSAESGSLPTRTVTVVALMSIISSRENGTVARCHKTAEKISKRAFKTIADRRSRELDSRTIKQRAARAYTNLQEIKKNSEQMDPRLNQAFDLVDDWIADGTEGE